MTVGPVDVITIGFPGNKFSGQIAPALMELVDSGTIRVLDLLFVQKDAEGALTTLEIEDLDQEGRGIGRQEAPWPDVRPGQGWDETARRRGIAGRQSERPVSRGTAPA